MDLRSLFSSLFIMLNKKTYILLRIEFLVAVVTVLFLVMCIMDIFRRHFHKPLIKTVFNILDAVSDSIVLHILGAMQTAPIKNQLFPVWAIVIVNFRNSIDFISGYGVPDRGGRRFTEWRNVMKLLGVAFLYQTRSSKFVLPLWSLWALQILRSYYRFIVRNLAARSIWHGRSSSLISEYMRTDRDPSKFENCNPQTMEGYKYLVYGETNQRVKLQRPRYVLYIDSSKQQMKTRIKPFIRRENTTTVDALTTLDKIWLCDGRLLHSNNSQGDDLKDLSLAFALSRLLRCRLEDVALQADTLRINQKLTREKIVDKEAKRAFRIMEMQLAFLNDYFNTRYPMVFWCGLPSLSLSLIQSVATFAVVCWLSVDIRKVYKPPVGDTSHLVHGFNIDIFITWIFMFFMMFKEIWEMVTYLLSDWTRLLLTCIYERFKCKCIRNTCIERAILSFFKSNIIAERWHGVIDQYIFLQSYDGSPTIWNLIHKLTIGIVPKKDEGAELGDAINVPDCVKPAILKSLRSLDLEHGYLPNRITSLPNIDGDTRWQYRRACFELPTCSHIILVWHIATSLCEIDLAKKHAVNLGKPWFLCGLLSCFSCSSKSYLMDENKLPGMLKENYITANSLSRYCAYLLVSKPELIPDSFLVPKITFQETVNHARDYTLKGCDSLLSKYNKLMQEAEEAAKKADQVKKGEDILQQGALLAKELLRYESTEQLWKILADVWAELFVHIAPSWNAEAHKKCLESGGEFITHIWALLWHCGIEKSKLWPVEEMPEHNAPGAHQNHNVISNDVQTEQEMQAGARPGEREEVWSSELKRAAAQVQNSQTENVAHYKDGTGSSVTKTNTFMRQAAKDRIWIYETEDNCDKEDMIVGEPYGQIDRDKKQMDGGTASAEDTGEGMASITSTESESIRRSDAMSWPDQQKRGSEDSAKSRYDGLELAATRISRREDKHGMLKIDTVDGAHGSGLVNRHSNVVRGLKNLGNTCYFNAVLQSLFALNSVRTRMVGPDALKGPLGLELKHLFMETCEATDAEGTLVPEKLFKIMCSCSSIFKLGEMEDSNSMLRSLLAEFYSEEPRMIESLFHGQVSKNVSGKECLHTSYTTQNLDLSLAIPSKISVSIEDCLEVYASGDIEGWHCTDCSAAAGNTYSNQTDTTLFDDDLTEQPDSETHQKEQPSYPPGKQISTTNQDKRKLTELKGETHQLEQNQKEEKKIYRAAAIAYRISKAPPVLIIQLKRFDYDVHHDTPEKLVEHVSFQETLDITKFMDPRSMENEAYKYHLVAVIVHDEPSLDRGHNFAYVRASSIRSKQQESVSTCSWYRASDEDVRKVSLKEVLECQAYILFYERLTHLEVKTNVQNRLAD